jgi:hypothetical protein
VVEYLGRGHLDHVRQVFSTHLLKVAKKGVFATKALLANRAEEWGLGINLHSWSLGK